MTMIKLEKTGLRYLMILLGFMDCLISCSKSDSPVNTTITGVSVSSLRPIHGPYNTIDTITGTGFDKIPQLDSVMINGKKLTIISRNAQQIIVQVPLLAGTGNIDIWYPGGMIQAPIFTYDSILMVTTIAGTEEAGEVNGKGSNARFWGPAGISLDHEGNIYVAESGGSSIRKIDTAGNVTSIAGPPAPEADFVNGKGSVARFSSPIGMCMTPGGFLVVADQFNYRVRKVTTDGVVSTYAGEEWDAKPQDGAFDGDAATSTFDAPFGVATDQIGNIYVADTYNNKIRKISTTGIVSSFAGGGYYLYGLKDGLDTAARFYSPTAIASDSAGNVYVLDNENQYLRKITPDGNVTTLFGHIVPEITGPYDVFSAGALATDKNGNLFFSVSFGIIKMTPDGKLIRYAVGGTGDIDGPAQIATYRYIAGIAVDDAGNLFITDNNRIRKIGWQ